MHLHNDSNYLAQRIQLPRVIIIVTCLLFMHIAHIIDTLRRINKSECLQLYRHSRITLHMNGRLWCVSLYWLI